MELNPNERRDQVIQGLYLGDLLDHRIGVWPRMKTSSTIQLLLSGGFQKHPKGHGPFLPEVFKKIIHQFMIANKYVGAGKYLPDRKDLQLSLMVRLDMHEPINDNEKSKFDYVKGDLFSYIAAQTRKWQEKGFITRWAEGFFPVFHPCVEGWTARGWNGTMPEKAQSIVEKAQAPDTIFTALVCSGEQHISVPMLRHERSGQYTYRSQTTEPSYLQSTNYVKPAGRIQPLVNFDAQVSRVQRTQMVCPSYPYLSRDASIGVAPRKYYQLDGTPPHVQRAQSELPSYTSPVRNAPLRETPEWLFQVDDALPHVQRAQTVLPYRSHQFEHAPYEGIPQRLFQVDDSVSRRLRAQTALLSYDRSAQLGVSQRVLPIRRKRSADSYHERQERKRQCLGRLTPISDPAWIDLTSEKQDTHSVVSVQTVDATREIDVQHFLDNIEVNEPLPTSNPPSRVQTRELNSITNTPPSAPHSTLHTQHSFSHLISSLSHAHTHLSTFAPTTLAELSALSRYWNPEKTRTECLTELLFRCKEHVEAMGKYFDGAIELMKILLEEEEKLMEENDGEVENGDVGNGQVENEEVEEVEEVGVGGNGKEMKDAEAGVEAGKIGDWERVDLY